MDDSPRSTTRMLQVLGLVVCSTCGLDRCIQDPEDRNVQVGCEQAGGRLITPMISYQQTNLHGENKRISLPISPQWEILCTLGTSLCLKPVPGAFSHAVTYYKICRHWHGNQARHNPSVGETEIQVCHLKYVFQLMCSVHGHFAIYGHDPNMDW